MRVVSPFTFPVLPLSWESKPGQKMLTVVVKATFVLVPGGEATLGETQDPLGGDHLWDGDARAGLFRPTDWVPWKPRADVLLVGSARSAQPVPSLVARLACAGVDKRVRVFGSRAVPGTIAPFVEIPLRDERAARTFDNPRGTTSAPNVEPVDSGAWPTFGPVHPQCPARRAQLDEACFAWAYRLGGPPPPGFDFAFFNAAPPEQRVAHLPPGAPLVLENLIADRPLFETRLPSARPRADVGGRALPLTADTLWIDADRGIAVITWRGALEVDVATLAQGTIEIAIDRESPPAEPKPKVPAAFRSTVDLPPDDPARGPSMPFSSTRPSPTRPPAVVEAPRPRSSAMARFGATIEAPPEASSHPATPFTPEPAAPIAAPIIVEAKPAVDLRRTIDAAPDSARAAQTPFVAGQSSLAAPAAPNKRKPPREFTGTMLADDARPAAPAVPFAAPEGTKAIPSLDRYAAVSVDLWAARSPRAEILRRHDLDEEAWIACERHHERALETEAREGRCDLSLALGKALRAGRERQAAPAPPARSIDDYARIRASLDGSRDPAATLSAEGLSTADWQAIHRSFHQRAAADGKLSEAIRKALAAARRARILAGIR